MAVERVVYLTVLCFGATMVWSHEWKALEAWLEHSCTSDDGCGADLAVCYKGKCLCSPGYYYSRTKNICLAMCPYTDLQPTFVRYPASAITNFNTADFPGTVEQCLASCGNNPRCRSVDYCNGDRCFIQPVTPLDIPDDHLRQSDNGCDLYQRACL